ncbi:malto-oligosyltrehalose trehalohydrolase [Leifsonia xyli subsp. cynodontis DSM 46306]|uniref:Malto-oligosyltrehalose trehalohydrolase n=1 Tax=Leifsonia xyli subsp. cynodontis DSM 46306 TaxID=1389489 RepID=U3P9H6_LEIXC|nr:malto-oligosyltrehalose trehalohydrolase [Leifsonia xyli]AGW42476.1 malto-oligosyltrehalose trehalohydrolase [Leifsonia xyli subsp. cynodontis DSM 46306]
MSDRRFPVWAPRANDVAVVAPALGTFALTAAPDGWWRLPEPLDAGPEPLDYGFVVDGSGPHPDPRSRRQPNGVHALGREFDPAPVEPWPGREATGAVLYELHLGTFTPEGTLDAAAERLDHLAGLGVEAVELLPVNAYNGPYGWGYDGVLWYAVHEPYGGPEAYQRFVAACHRRGIAVIQDVVYNHLGPSGNALPVFGPYLSEGRTTWGASVNLDGALSDEVRRHILDNAAYWLRDLGVDGLRLDAVHALQDSRAEHILEALARQTEQLREETGRPLTLIAESDLNDPRLIRSRARHGYGLDAQWNDDAHHSIHANLTGETFGYYVDFGSPDALVKVFERGFFHDGTYSAFRERHHGRPLEADQPHSQLVAFSQDHDQIGNRAAGDRLSATLDDGRLAVAAALTLLGPFTPMLFMGEEWAAGTPWPFFASHPEPDLAEATRSGRIAEFARMGWDPAAVADPMDPATFHAAKLDWSERDSERGARMLDWYRTLTRLRRTMPTDARAREVRFADGVFSFVRERTRVTVGLSGGGLPHPDGTEAVLASFGDAVLVTRVSAHSA